MRFVYIDPMRDNPTSESMSHRYLTKMCDQVVSLISSEHAQTILWSEEDGNEDGGDNMFEVDQDESDRIITFVVAQTSEQEESVTVREGFKVRSSGLCTLVPSRLTSLTFPRPIPG